jgi:uncharacterized LabA/DUF88 family protein
MKRKDQRVGIFIDIQNLYHSSKNLYHARVNYKELLRELVAGRELITAMAYVVKSGMRKADYESAHANGDMRTADYESAHANMRPSEQPKEEAAFFDALKKSGLELRVKDLQIYAGGMKKADWDVGMAVDAIKMSDILDVVILVTGDGDFIPLVEYLKLGKGRTVEVAAFGRSASGKIKEAADEFLDLEKLPKVLLKK